MDPENDMDFNILANGNGSFLYPISVFTTTSLGRKRSEVDDEDNSETQYFSLLEMMKLNHRSDRSRPNENEAIR